MKRRDLLKLGVVATSAPGCATVLSAAAPVVPESIVALFTKLDAQLVQLDSASVLSGLLDGVPNREKASTAPWFQEGDALARRTLKAFLVANTFQSLTPEQWKQPLVTERLTSSMADLDEAMLGMTTMLEQSGQGDRKAVRQALNDDPSLGMRIMGAIDQQAGVFGVGVEGRTKLRTAAAQAVSRMRQSPDLLISEVTGKIRKLEARHGVSEEAQRRLGVSMASVALFQDGAQPAGGGVTPLSPPPMPPPLPDTTPSDVAPVTSQETSEREREERKAIVQERRKQERKSSGIVTMTVGGIALGIGALLLLTGNIFAITVGVLVGGAGLIMLIVGLIIFLASL